MRRRLTTGVHLMVLPTSQFKTIRVMVSFATKIISPEQLAQRALLANILEVSSMRYPTQRAVARALAELYGANFGTTVVRKGTRHVINFILTIPAPQFIPEHPALLTAGLDFLREMIFHPLLQQGHFEDGMVEQQRQILDDYLTGMVDDKQTLAAQRLAEEYFNDPAQQVGPLGAVTDVRMQNAMTLAVAYQQMLTADEVFIGVTGAVDEVPVINAVAERLPFDPRCPLEREVTYHQPERAIVTDRVLKLPVSQAKFDLAFRLPIAYGTPDYYAAVVMNGLFGGTALSYLFTTVREQASLAYYANSTYDVFRQTVIVETGIEAKNVTVVRNKVLTQLHRLQTGEISSARLDQVKATLINDYRANLDLQGTPLNRELTRQLIGQSVSVAKVIRRIEAVTKQAVMQAARKCQLQATILLKGATGDAPN
ncbi:EF-P 5-aminopentanol modification-associated protein YfmF [Ligilactobacillus sp. LYQ60]|uniref:EF-P 5-aminopentanol modification-associated protein YfmF n=1 Tax=unclassified Ligilactobacillus TaxID=2767920 RepID=UPI00385329DD